MPRRPPSIAARRAAALACCVITPAWAQLGASGSGTVGDAMTPALVLGSGERDPAGLGPYRLPASRSPSGLLYDVPYLARELRRSDSPWAIAGFAELGWMGGSAANRNALFRKYSDAGNGPALTRVDLEAVRADEARYVEFSAGSIGRDDQHLALQFGRYNDYRVSLSLGDAATVNSTSARSIWQGVGSGSLTLTPFKGVLAGGASTNNAVNAAALQALLRQSPEIELGVQRRSAAARLDLQLGQGWSFTSSYALERRKGARAFGGNEGNGETIEPIDARTRELSAALQFADEGTQLNVLLAASWFRNAIDTLSWENPFQHPVGSLRILGGRADLAPDNEAYQARLEYARALPQLWRGRFTATLAAGAQRQNDRLIPPTVTRGVGAPFGTAFDGDFERWNTTAALGQERAHAAIDTRLADLSLALAPAERLSVRATLRHHETRNHTDYIAFNPSTGQFGYIIQDTNASTIFSGSNNVHYRSIPFEGAQDNLRLAGELQLRRRAVLTAELERENFRRAHRERDRTWEDRLRLGYSDRSFEAATLRLSYERASRRGSPYNSNPYRDFYTESLPGYTDTLANVLDRLHNLEELRKYDLADRRQQLFKARLNLLPRDDVDLALTAQSRLNEYPAEFGRSGVQAQDALHLDLGFLPAPTTAVNAYASQQWSRMRQGGAGDLGSAVAAGCLSLPPSCSNSFGALHSIYPVSLAWSASSRERSSSYGLQLRHELGKTQLELQLLRVSSRSPLAYTYASANALQTPSAAAQAADGFADLSHELRVFDAGLRVPVSAAVALRLWFRRESTRIADWHYSGLDQGNVVGNRVYLDAGPVGYRVNLFGAFVQISL